MRIFVLYLLVAVFLPAATNAQYQYYNPNDERFKFLALKKAEVTLHELRDKYDNAKALYAKGLIAKEAYGEAERAYKLAQVEFQQAMLSVIFEKPHITIESAVKYITADGKKRARLTLTNTTGGTLDMGKLGLLDDNAETAGLIDQLDFGKLTNVYVALKYEGSIISQPYEQKIDEMAYGTPVIMDFGLLKDLDDITVSFTYGDKVDEKRITLLKDSKMNPITINSMQFSQEANLGGTARYDLALEQYAVDNAVYQMLVINLPQQIAYEFQSADNGLRISQVKFANGITLRGLNLILSLPDRADSSVVIDSPLTFYALAVTPNEAARLATLRRNRFTDEDISRIAGGSVRLELVPRGVGEIEVTAPNLFFDVGADDTVVCNLAIRNIGSATLFNIKTDLSLPYDWYGTTDPPVIDKLAPGGEQKARVICFPSREVGVGDFEVTLRTSSLANNRRIEGKEKVIRVHISSRSGIILPGLLIVAIVVAIGALVRYGVRLAKR